MKPGDFKVVEFIRASTPYQPGDRATFNADVADRMVRQRTARIVEAAEPDADLSRPAAEQSVVRDYRKK